MKVYYTKYDGFYVVIKNKKVAAYEGLALCPKSVQTWLQKNSPISVNCFWWEVYGG